MKKLEIHERLAAARLEAGYQTASEAARAFGWNENTYRSHENGERGLKHDVIYKYARAFGTSYSYIAVDEKWKNIKDIGDENSLPISGYIDNDGRMRVISTEIRPYQVEYYARMPFSTQRNCVAFEVAAQEIFGFLTTGDLIVVARDQIGIIDGVDQLLVIDFEGEYKLGYAKIEFGKDIQLRLSSRGRPNTVIKPRYFWAVIAILPNGQWTKVDRLSHVGGRQSGSEEE